MKAGLIPRADVEVAAFAMWSIVHGIVSLIVRDRCPMIPQEMYSHAAAGAFQYVMAAMEKLAQTS
jgi:hypothetical protein